MKKTILALICLMKLSSASAAMQQVTDPQQAKDLALGAITAYNATNFQLWNCQQYGRNFDLNPRFFSSFVESAKSVYLEDNGQPILQFANVTSGSDIKYVNVTSDSTDTRIVQFQILEASMGEPTPVNSGTLSKPKITIIPAKMEITSTITCKLK